MAKRKNGGTDIADTDDFEMSNDGMDDILGSDEEEIIDYSNYTPTEPKEENEDFDDDDESVEREYVDINTSAQAEESEEAQVTEE